MTHSLELRGVFASSGVTLRWPWLDRCVALLHVAWQEVRLSRTGHSPPPSDYLQKSGSPNEISSCLSFRQILVWCTHRIRAAFLAHVFHLPSHQLFRVCSLMNTSGLLLALFGDLHKAPFSMYTLHHPPKKKKKKKKGADSKATKDTNTRNLNAFEACEPSLLGRI